MNKKSQENNGWSLGKKLKFSAMYFADALKENIEGVLASIQKPKVAATLIGGMGLFVPAIASAASHQNIPQPETGASYEYVLKIDPGMYETFNLQDKDWLTLTWIYSALGIPKQELENTINTTVDEQSLFYKPDNKFLEQINQNFSYKIVEDSTGKKSINIIDKPDCCPGDVINEGDIFYFSKETGQKLFPEDLDELLRVADVEKENGKTYITITKETLNSIYESIEQLDCQNMDQDKKLSEIEQAIQWLNLNSYMHSASINSLKNSKTSGGFDMGIGYSTDKPGEKNLLDFYIGKSNGNTSYGMVFEFAINQPDQTINVFEQKRNDGTLESKTTEKTKTSSFDASALIYGSRQNLLGPFGLSIGIGPSYSKTKESMDVLQQNYNRLENPEGQPNTIFLPEEAKTRWGGSARIGIPVSLGKNTYLEPNYTATILQDSKPAHKAGLMLKKTF